MRNRTMTWTDGSVSSQLTRTDSVSALLTRCPVLSNVAGDDEQIEMEEGYEDMAIDPNDTLAVEVAKNKTMTMKTAPKKRKVTGPLIAIIKGPYYEDEASDDDSTRDLQKYFESFKLQFLGSQGQSRRQSISKITDHADTCCTTR